MLKKYMAMLFIGLLTISLAACGNQDGEQASGANEQQYESTTTVDKSYKSIFRTSVFLGDSITEGLSFHEILDDANVMGKAGATALFALDDVDVLASKNPKNVFIHLGSDDILWPTNNPKEFSMTQYAILIDKIKGKLPNANIMIVSVTPVTAEAEKEEPRYKNIKDYNKGLKELAAKEQVKFIDLSPVFQNNQNLHDTDGIHFKKEYYTLLLDFLKDQVK
ncbi:lysophospholipase [Paenibacillus sp. SYP-B3998]|uniref:Lysophospholipase n=1 Tax=Paenibacillus sp. SYP-B3998 TaxID=2678564 RepID=A0A6G4A5N4_9BACL|nr:GDSL-type esterase/lipase family protein [Paenibacillus sp. SYP-B3998]NEW09705.1 lysophospholipase [Paenibacillus sp. SYP-B3998]